MLPIYFQPEQYVNSWRELSLLRAKPVVEKDGGFLGLDKREEISQLGSKDEAYNGIVLLS